MLDIIVYDYNMLSFFNFVALLDWNSNLEKTAVLYNLIYIFELMINMINVVNKNVEETQLLTRLR